MTPEDDAKLAEIQQKLREIGIKSHLIFATADPNVLLFDRSDGNDEWIRALIMTMITQPSIRGMFKRMAEDVEAGRLSMEAIKPKEPTLPEA